MTTFLEEIGLAAWPLLILAAATLWQSIRYVGNGRLQHLVAAAGAAVVSLVLSVLSAVVGFQYSVATALGAEVPTPLVLIGVSEALSGVVLALLTCLLAALLLSMGGYRSLARGRRLETESHESPSRA